ncbi:MAG: hypothetical protein H3C35_04665 [Bacteroidetes bacterium]|nr:hypothetical protein [Bacteroidota bacterium]
MKQLFIIIFAISMFVSAIIAGDKSSYKGYLVDHQCGVTMSKHPEKAYKMGKKHTRACGLDETCSLHGYGIITGEGKYIKFDDKGDKKAHAFLEKTKKKNNILVEIRGELNDNILTVKEIKDAE